MEPSFNLPDSTDWLDTPLSLLTPLESSLRCQVCKDFFDNPVITSCSHTFCSLCIRRCLSTEGKCPACRSSDQELKLRRNWAVQELVEAFQNARPSVLQLARRAADRAGDAEEEGEERPAPKKRKVAEQAGPEAIPVERRQTQSRSKGVDHASEPVAAEVIEDSQDEEYVPDDGLVACPICARRMKNEAVFLHLDSCSGDPAPPKKTTFGSLQPMPPARQQPINKPERLPVINYSILKENVLRKKLKDLGIPNWGPRPLIQRRHTEWMNLWNANCDSKTPKSKRELLNELDVWERTQGGNAAAPMETANSVMRKDFDSAAWSTDHDSDFKRLIANARKRSDALVRTTIPQASSAEQTPPDAQGQEQLIQPSIVEEEAQKPEQLALDSAGITKVADNEFHESQEPSDVQVTDAPR
ncbi:putative Postreplication repair E3 ubiquitin-protein ligase rad18 [Aspergillus steynii IBT 23096]|uniref:Postreplication repair E3 ubiquitin-protein ligase RAD18 n=1 Tax=Aspergillus steynii IBT 23096 TaxID=1392250 RepID=A0A2I2GEE4_9EURO|nr:putative Postreplication repair E3 ubiquitin-protein ligase rad18 [Aspergillus steynii IBT 23096]PLB51211.1 putative Postreplication repair E3 ubiquitin-protein ligase rad18 [Aspergillus steynii IBT 23096]